MSLAGQRLSEVRQRRELRRKKCFAKLFLLSLAARKTLGIRQNELRRGGGLRDVNSLSLSLPWLRSLSGLHDWRFLAYTPCGGRGHPLHSLRRLFRARQLATQLCLVLDYIF